MCLRERILTGADGAPNDLRDLGDDVGQQVKLAHLRQARNDVADAADGRKTHMSSLSWPSFPEAMCCKYVLHRCSASAGGDLRQAWSTAVTVLHSQPISGCDHLCKACRITESSPRQVRAEERRADEAVVCVPQECSQHGLTAPVQAARTPARHVPQFSCMTTSCSCSSK